MHDTAVLAEAARRAVLLASGVCREIQLAQGAVRQVTKDDKSPVTVADYASQAIIARELRERFGDIALVAEEDTDFLRQDEHQPHLRAVLEAVRTVWDDCTEDDLLEAIDIGNGRADDSGFWTLDPIDGTKGFLRGQQYAVSLAFIENGVPVAGAMGCPNLPRDFSDPLDEPDPRGSLYHAVLGEGVYESPCDDSDERPVKLTRLPTDKDTLSVCASVERAHSSTDDMDRVLDLVAQKNIEIAPPARLDSQAKYAVVARGQADAYMRLPTKKSYVEKIWDHAAGALVAVEAGCIVSDIRGHGLDFAHGIGLSENRGIICAAPHCHAMLVGAIKSLKIGV